MHTVGLQLTGTQQVTWHLTGTHMAGLQLKGLTALLKVGGAFEDWRLHLLSSWGAGTAFCTQVKSTGQRLLGREQIE